LAQALNRWGIHASFLYLSISADYLNLLNPLFKNLSYCWLVTKKL